MDLNTSIPPGVIIPLYCSLSTDWPMKKISNHSFFCLLASFVFIGLHPAAAQIDTRGVSMMSTAGGGPSYVRDTDALFFNPANLRLDERGSRVVFTFGSLQAFGGGSLLQFSHYNDSFVQGRNLTTSDVQSILDDWMGSVNSSYLRTIGASAEAVPFAIVARGYGWGAGLGIRTRAYTNAGFSRGLFDLLLVGTDQEGSFPVNMDIRSVVTTEISLGYSHFLPQYRLAIGIAPKYILGLNYARTTLDSYVELSDETITHTYDYVIQAAGNFNQDIGEAINLFESTGFLVDADPSDIDNPFSAVSGTGLGFDIGATYELSKNILVAASFTDIGYVRWTKNADAVYPAGTSLEFEGLDLDLDRIDDEFDGDFGAYVEDYFETLIDDTYDNVERQKGSFTSYTPAAFHAGGTWHAMKGLFVVNAGTTVGLNKSAGNLSRRPSLYVGGEFHPGRRFSFPIRTGVRVGGGGALTMGFGFGIQTPVYDFSLGLAGTPKSTFMGGGGRYMVGVSALTFRI